MIRTTPDMAPLDRLRAALERARARWRVSRTADVRAATTRAIVEDARRAIEEERARLDEVETISRRTRNMITSYRATGRILARR